ncbi:MAG TPA: M28 family peptidase [Chloroflexota bacterium]|nr:M28 family peptidase [Chloroflexota bacterium]
MAILLAAITMAAVLAVSGTVLSRGPKRTIGVQREEVGAYALQQLNQLASGYWARVAGEDDGAPPRVNGHDEFAAAWLREMRGNLHGLPLQVIAQPFSTPGFQHYAPPSRPGQNEIIMVPGAVDPDRALLIVTHYDGEPFSKGSAYDDTSGAAIMLAVAKLLGSTWRSRGLPSITVEFVLFDAEEQGLVGSGAYLFDLRQKALMPKPTVLVDEEQSGVGYPARPFGLRSKPPMPAYATTTRLSKRLANVFGPVTKPSSAGLKRMMALLKSARDQAYRQLRSTFPRLKYRGGKAAAFSPADEKYLLIGPNSVCCSDNAPFEALGLPTAMFSGDASYYDKHHSSWAYPFDQPQDTPTTLACDTGGKPSPTPALQAALALPVDLTTSLVAAYAPPSKGAGLSVFAAPAVKGRSTAFAGAALQKPRWSFGDGGTASGALVHHAYRRSGSFDLTVIAGDVTRRYRVHVGSSLPRYHAPFGRIPPPPIRPFHPRQLKGIRGCP